MFHFSGYCRYIEIIQYIHSYFYYDRINKKKYGVILIVMENKNSYLQNKIEKLEHRIKYLEELLERNNISYAKEFSSPLNDYIFIKEEEITPKHAKLFYCFLVCCCKENTKSASTSSKTIQCPILITTLFRKNRVLIFSN